MSENGNFEFDDPNIFRPDGDVSSDDRVLGASVQIRCPHCQSIGTFFSAIGRRATYRKTQAQTSQRQFDELSADIRRCPNQSCGAIVFTINSFTLRNSVNVCYPPELISFDPSEIPIELVDTLKEAIICHSQGAYRACAMMVRRLLEELCEDCGASGKTLHDRLRKLRTQITLPEELFDAMDELKALGNDAAHIEAKAYQTVDREEAELSIELAQEILKARYQHKSLVDRLRARRK